MLTKQLGEIHATMERARSAINVLDPNCDRDEWSIIAMAVKSEFGDAGFDIWDEWSSTAKNYNASDARSTWRSVKAEGGVGFGTLIFRAKEKGWKEATTYKAPTKAEIEARNATAAERNAKAAIELEAVQAATALRAQALWDASEPAVSHPYLTRKGVQSHGLRVGKWTRIDADTGEVLTVTTEGLLIPIRDRTRKIWSLQCIQPAADRKKLYMKDSAKRGHFFPLGSKPLQHEGRPVFLLGEGYATCASAHEATGHMTLVCFDTSGLMPVAKQLRERMPDAVIMFLADNDTETDGNPGVTHARAAAQEVGGLVAVPPPGDFNDLQLADGHEAVYDCISVALQADPQPDFHVQGIADQEHEQVRESEPEFGKPVDLFNVDPVPQIPLDSLPDAIASYAKDQSELMGCDHSIISMAALVAAASCLHDGVQVQVKRHDHTWRESARLWVAVVGSPSSKKSPAIAKAVSPVRKIDSVRREKSKGALSHWEMQHAQNKKPGAKQDGSLKGPEPDRPPMKRAIVEDATIEAMSEILKDNPQGVLCVRDELTGWLGSMDAYKGSKAGASADRANWLELFNGGPRSVDRLTRGSIHIPNWSSCLVGGIQPDMLRRVVVGMGHDGLLQRFLPVIAYQSNSIGVDRVPDMDAIQRYRDLFDHLAAIIPTPLPVLLEESAHVVRERVDVLAAKIGRAYGHEGLEAWLGKWSGMFARLLLIFHVIECVQLSVHPTSRMATGKSAEMVERLLCGTLLRHAINFYGEIIDVNDRHQRVRELARLILAKGWDVVQKRELQRSWKAASKMQAWELHDVLNRLCDMDWLQADRESEPAADGKPRRWFVNPAVHEMFAAHANAERMRRAEVVETLRELKATHSQEKERKQ